VQDIKQNNLTIRGIPKIIKRLSMDYVTSILIVLMPIIISVSQLNTFYEHIDGN
jgi:hypothetical protein